VHKVYVYYTVGSLLCDPDDVTAMSGVTPYRVWRRGDLVVKQGTRQFQTNGWSVESRLGTDANLVDQITSVLDQLSPGWRYFCDLGRLAEPYMQ
jgi:hypothetical protein